MKTNKNLTRRYCRKIRSWLPCPAKMKKIILGDVYENVQEFLEENPHADMADLHAQFGTPQQMAASYVSDLDMPKLLHDLRLRKRIFTAVIIAVSAALMAALLMWGWGITRSIEETHNESNGYFVEQIVVH